MSALVALALNAGVPVIQKILSGRLGDAAGTLAGEVIHKIADQLQIAPEEVDAVAEQYPGKVIEAMRSVEVTAPDLLWQAGLQGQFALLQSEATEPAWMRAWRPLGMYLIMGFWAWNIVGLHVLNAIFKIALPPAPWDALGWLTGVYFSLYMGGHTVKDVVSKWVAK